MPGLLLRITGILLLGVGFVVFWLPIPVGALMMAIGGLILFGKNPKWINFVRRRRSLNPMLDRLLVRITKYCPRSIQAMLVESEPQLNE